MSNIFNFADNFLSLPIETLESSLKKNPELVNTKGYGGQTALHKAVLIGNHSVALTLLQYGANPNIATDTGETSLHIACYKGALKILLALITFGGDLNMFNRSGCLPFHCAAQNGSIIVVQFLSEVYGCISEVHDVNNSTALHAACAGGHLDLVNFLLEYKKGVWLTADSNGNTVLHCSAISGVSGVCWSILVHGGESLLTTKNKRGQTPALIAETSVNVSHDCKKWLKKWTQEYEKKKKISLPTFSWYLLLTGPFFAFHSIIVLAVFSFPECQWAIGLPGFFLLLLAMRKQQHRMFHPARWANPMFLGTYMAGLSSSLMNSIHFGHYSAPRWCLGALILFLLSLLYFLILILTKDPGLIPANAYTKDALIRIAEDRLEGRYCPQCFLSAPVHSHHCRLCGRCFLHFDHHCLFLNRCIAAKNHWHFIVFILLNSVTMSFYILTCILFTPVTQSELGFVMWLHSMLAALLCTDVWTFLLLACHAVSLLWIFSLLRHQYQVIGKKQIAPLFERGEERQADFSTLNKVGNLFQFLFNNRLYFVKDGI